MVYQALDEDALYHFDEADPQVPLAPTLRECASLYWTAIHRQGEPASTGIACLDSALGGGLFPGRLLAFVGGPGSGKTALSNQIAYHVAQVGRPVVYLSLEESEHALLAKTISRVGNIDYGRVLRGDGAVKPQINKALTAICASETSLRLRYLTRTPERPVITLDDLRTLAQPHFANWSTGSGVIVVDYLQLWARGSRVSGSVSRVGMADRRELHEVVSALAESVRQLARELNCTVLLLSSQNRASGYQGQTNTLASAKESGDIEYCCDVLVGIGSDIDPNTRSASTPSQSKAPRGVEWRRLEVAKNRLGGRGSLQLLWRGDRQTMSDPATSNSRASRPSQPTEASPEGTQGPANHVIRKLQTAKRSDITIIDE